MTTLKSDQQKAMAAAKKVERERDGAQALRDYEAEKRAVQANMVRLRALRLAKETADAQRPAPLPPARKSAKKPVKKPAENKN